MGAMLANDMQNLVLTGNSADLLNNLGGLAAMLAGLAGRRLLASNQMLRVGSGNDQGVILATRMESMIHEALDRTVLSVSSGTIPNAIMALFGVTFHANQFGPVVMQRVVHLLEDINHQLKGNDVSDQTAMQLVTIMSNLQSWRTPSLNEPPTNASARNHSHLTAN